MTTVASPDPRPVAVITGASRGIGRAIALDLAADWDIVALARDAADLDALAGQITRGGGRCEIRAVDVTDATAVGTALRGVRADVLVNNAGVGVLKPFLDTAPDEWRRMIDVNINALFHVTRALLPGMVERGRGHVVTIGSIAGRSAFEGGSCYAATKHFVNAWSESLLLEVREAGVKVSVVQPGGVATEFNGGDPSAPGASWKLQVEDVARAVRTVLATPPNTLIFQLEVRALIAKPPGGRP